MAYYDNKKNDDNDIHYRLIANHEHLKNRNRVYKTDYLQLYIEKKFQCDKSTTKNLINFIENFINNINITDFIVEDILNETIKDIENGSIH
jgi:hypothetical protein